MDYYNQYLYLKKIFKNDTPGLNLLYEFHNSIIDHIRILVGAKSGHITEPKFFDKTQNALVKLNDYIQQKNRQEDTNIKLLPKLISRTEIHKFWKSCAKQQPSNNNEHPPEEKEKWDRKQPTHRHCSKVKETTENEIIKLLNNLHSSTITKEGMLGEATVKTLRDIVAENPKDYLAHLFLGILYAENKQFEESKKEIIKALDLNLKLSTLKLIQVKENFSKPLQFLSVLTEILEESFLDYEIYIALLMVLDNWAEYEKCISLCEIELQSFFLSDYPRHLIQHNACFYDAIVGLKKRDQAETKRYFLYAASSFDRLLEEKSEYFYLTHSFMKRKPPRPILINSHFKELFSSKNLKELRERSEKILDYCQNECLNNRLQPEEFEKWGYFVTRYHLSWQTTIAYALHNALSLKQFDIDTMKEAALHALKKRDVNEKKIFNACENFISLLSQYKNFEKAQKDETILLKELWKVSDKSKDITDIFEQLQDIKAEMKTKTMSTQPTVIKPPPPILDKKTAGKIYAIYLSNPTGIGIDCKGVTEKEVKAKYLKNRKNYDIFIFDRTVEKKAKIKIGDKLKKSILHLDLDENILRLLILFLKYKDAHLPYMKIYNKAWEASVHYDEFNIPTRVMNGLKTAVSTIRTTFEDIENFRIPPARAGGYTCQGNFKFCLILSKAKNDWYTLEGV